jgi:hypothetical protein
MKKQPKTKKKRKSLLLKPYLNDSKKSKNTKKGNETSITGGITDIKDFDLKFATPLQIINSSKYLIDLYRKGKLKDGKAKTLTYMISTLIIPAYKLLVDERLGERYNRIADALEKRNEMTEKNQNEIG